MKTFILMWRPAISSYKMEDLEHELQEYPDCGTTGVYGSMKQPTKKTVSSWCVSVKAKRVS